MTARERGSCRTIDAYPVLWENLETAKATYGWFADISEAWLGWTGQFGSFGSRILDLGSGLGVHACYYAICNPGSQVVGVDVISEGVARAGELATELSVDNARFVCRDFRQVDVKALGGPFDTVTASTFLVDVQPDLLSALFNSESTSQSVRLMLERTESKLLAGLAACVADGGTYYGLERAPSAVAFARLLGGLIHAGFVVDGSLSDMLRVNAEERLPAVRATKAAQVRSMDLDEMTELVRRLYPNDFVLELLERDPPAERLWGREIHVNDDNGAGVTRLDVLRLSSGAVVYRHTTSRGYLEIRHVATADEGIVQGETFMLFAEGDPSVVTILDTGDHPPD
jgi:SAM-dependent methyltransferase